ncbi:MAG: pre-peptidase C-terminal domain-containing protein [Planctomycetes bacterium]|nr:pre-peptidase C-terminal domain-containing protein [Planctomycetota bacterium]
MQIRNILAAWLVVAGWASLACGADAPDFQRDVAPVLRKYCVSCHAADDPENGLVLDSFAGLQKGGENGAAVVPGAADKSRLILMIEGKTKPVMPPKDNEAPTAAEIALLRRWVEAGAKGPAAGDAPQITTLVTPKIKLRAPARKSLTAAAFSPDGKLLALGAYGEVQLVNVTTQALARQLADIHGNVATLGFTADGKQLVVAAGEPGVYGEATVWEIPSGKLVRRVVGHKDSLYAVAVDPSGKLLATGSYDQQIKLWQLADGRELRTLTGHNGAIFDLAFRPDGKVLASASGDRTIKLWDVATGARLDTLSQPLKEQNAVAFNPDGTQLAAGGVDSRIRIYGISKDAAENTNPLLFTRFGHEGAVLRLAYARGGGTLVSAGEDRAIRVWDTKNYTERRQFGKQSDLPQGLAIAADGKALAIARLDGTWGLFDAMSGAALLPPKPELASIDRRGLQSGQSMRVKLTGKNLGGATGATLRAAGVDAKLLSAKLVADPKAMAGELQLDLLAAAGVPRTAAMLAVAGPGGASNELTIYIDDLPQVVEAEPNDVRGKATQVTMPTAYWGNIASPGDQDHYQFEAAAGETIVAELSAKRIGSTLNATLILLDPQGEVVASNNDFDGQADPLLAYKIPAAGRYTLRVHDLTMQGMATNYYRLSVGKFAYVTGAYPLTISVGRETSVELVGYNLPMGHSVKLSPTAAGDVPVPVDAKQYRVARALQVMATGDRESLEKEPNDESAQATPIGTIPPTGLVSVNGRIGPRHQNGQEDFDLFRFEAEPGQQIVIETLAARRSSPVDTKIEVLHAAGKPVERVLLQAMLDSSLTFRPINSDQLDPRLTNWEEIGLNQLLYMQGEVGKIFRMPQGPDSGSQLYALNGKRRAYFDTSGVAHAMDEACYIVEPHAPGTQLTPNGLPVFKVFYANDDDSDRKLGADSRVHFTAPARGSYLVRVRDVRGFGGDRFAYRLTLHTAQPDFTVTLATAKPAIEAKSGVGLLFRTERIDGFDGDIQLEFENVPPGYTATSTTIQAGHVEARSLLLAGEVKELGDWSKVRITAKAEINGQLVTKPVANMLTPAKLVEQPKVRIFLEPRELTIAPGTTIKAKLRIERLGFEGPVAFDVQNLPHGIIVDNIGLNGILIPAKDSERELFLNAADFVPETDRYCFAEAKIPRATKDPVPPAATPAVMLHVRRGPGVLARAEAEAPQVAAPKK